MDKILVVDDEAGILDLTRMMLEAQGYWVSTAWNGEEAMRVAEAELPDLILLDVVMPGASGFEVCKTLKRQSKTCMIPVVMFSALDREVDRRMGMEAGADGYLTKPFTSEILKAEVTRRLEETRRVRFSGALGISHAQLRGRKMLLEFDPSTPYERSIRDLALEARSHGESLAVLTYGMSALHRALQGDEGVDVIPVSPNTIFSPIIDAHDGEVVLIYDSLTDLAISAGFDVAYGFARNILERIAEPRITALFLLNPEAHQQRETSSFRSLFSDQVVHGEEGLKKIRLS